MYSLQLTHPFGLLVSGGTKTGETTFVKKLLGNIQVMIDPPPENIKYFYSEYQDTFAEIKSLVPNIEFIEGVPDVIFDSINSKTRNLYIFDGYEGGVLEVAHDDLLEALTECCMNVYLKTIKVNPSVLKRLTPLKEDLRFVADNRNPLNQRKEVLLQKGEGFLSLILTPIVEQLASLLIR